MTADDTTAVTPSPVTAVTPRRGMCVVTDMNTCGKDDRRPGGQPGSVHAGLDVADLAACRFAIAELIRRRPDVPPSLRRTADRLDRVITAASRTRRQSDCGQPELEPIDLLGTGEAARLVGRNVRWVQRHRDELGGRLLPSGRLVFDAAVLRRWLHATTHTRSEGSEDD